MWERIPYQSTFYLIDCLVLILALSFAMNGSSSFTDVLIHTTTSLPLISCSAMAQLAASSVAANAIMLSISLV